MTLYLRYMDEADRRKLVGKRVVFSVTRDGRPVERAGTVTRVTPTLIWISAFLYTHDEIHSLREAREAA